MQAEELCNRDENTRSGYHVDLESSDRSQE